MENPRVKDVFREKDVEKFINRELQNKKMISFQKVTLYHERWLEKKSLDFQIYVCGWAEYNGVVLLAKELLDVIANEYLQNENEIEKLPYLLNGNFSIIIQSSQNTYLISDRMRNFPIIYFYQNDTLTITDDIFKYRQENNTNFKIDEVICEQFLSVNYIVGPYTIFNDVFSTQSGEIVTINHSEKKIERNQYFQWKPYMEEDSFTRDYAQEAKLQDSAFMNVFDRMIKSVPNINNWIIPLSGGYDSRAIVNYLYKLGVKNVICFSYGMESNIQSEISRNVAEALGYEWHFVDYKVWIQKMKEQNVIDSYLEFGFNGSSVAHLQDFPAIYALKELGILNKNDVFVPGHALEVIAGNHLKMNMKSCTTFERVMTTLQHHFSGFGYYTKNKNKVFKHIQNIVSNYNVQPKQVAECFDWQERQTKFIANSVKVYEYFGYESRIPEWDEELMKYWDNIGFNYKFERNMFKDVFKKYLTIKELMPIPFANDLIIKQKRNFKDIVIENIPFTVKKILKKTGFIKSLYYLNEGSHLIYSQNKETIADYLKSYNAPAIVRSYLKPYATSQKIADFEINSVSTLLLIRKAIVKNVSKA